MTQPKKVKIFSIPRISVIGMGILVKKVPLRAVVFDPPIPDDATILSVCDNPEFGSFDYYVSSDSFPEIPDGQRAPRILAMMSLDEKV